MNELRTKKISSQRKSGRIMDRIIISVANRKNNFINKKELKLLNESFVSITIRL